MTASCERNSGSRLIGLSGNAPGISGFGFGDATAKSPGAAHPRKASGAGALSTSPRVVAFPPGRNEWPRAAGWAWASWEAGSSPGSTYGPGWACGTPTCVGSGARTRRPRRGSGGPGAVASGRGSASAFCLHRGDGGGARDRLRSGSAGRTTRGSRTWSEIVAALGRGATLVGDRLREAAGPQPPGSDAHGGAGREGGRAPRLPRGPALLAEPRPRSRDRLGPRGRAQRPPIPRARRRGAQRSPHALVLAGRSPGRRRAQRHDVPQPRGGSASCSPSPARRGTASGPRRSRPRSRRSNGRSPEYADLLRR